MSEDELFKSFIDALTVSYYRDLVVPRDKHTGRLSDLSRLKRESAGRWRAERKMPSPRRRGKSVWRRRAMYSLEDWYDAQERARYYVKGNSPRVADNFDGGTVELAQALVSGIIVKRGDTWVYEQGDSKSKHFGALALQGLDLARRTFFKPPVRATAELDELMADIYWYD